MFSRSIELNIGNVFLVVYTINYAYFIPVVFKTKFIK